MIGKYLGFMAVAGLLGGLYSCSSEPSSGHGNAEEASGELEIALTNAPADAACLRVTIVGSRTDVRTFPLTLGQNATFRLKGAPVGTDTVSADAFPAACNALGGVDPSWYSEPVVTKVSVTQVAHVALLMIHNGKLSVGIDFDNGHGPSTGETGTPSGGTFSSVKPYFLPTAPGVLVKAILTTGDSPNLKPDGVTPWRMVGIPDGAGAFDNGDGTFTLLNNQELTSAVGVPRAHGAKGAFVSKYTIRKSDLAVLRGEDLIQKAALWNATTASYDAPVTGTAFTRFCSADLPAPSALFDAASGLGFDGRLFFDGEESDGRALAHGLDGITWELPRLGKMSFENTLANPGSGKKTIVAELDDSTPGQVYFYVGDKLASGSPIERAGLSNGKLYGLRVVGFPVEPAAGIPTSPFELADLGNVENQSVAQLELASNSALVSRLNRPEDGAWDPNNPNDFYFVTTNAFAAPSRLWRVRFNDVSKPQLGGSFEMLLDGSEGQKMFDNLTIDRLGHIYLEEDVGNNPWLGRVLRYDIATDTLTPILVADPTLFDPTLASPTFQTADEEGSGIFDASDILGPGWLITVLQNHKASSDPELVEGGQIMAVYDPVAVF